MESNKIVDQGYKIILLMGPSKSTSISTIPNDTTNTSTFPQDIPWHLYEGISTIVHLLLSLLVSLQNGILQSSVLVSLQSNFVLTSPLTSLWKMFLHHLYKDIYTVTPIQVKSETSKSL